MDSLERRGLSTAPMPPNLRPLSQDLTLEPCSTASVAVGALGGVDLSLARSSDHGALYGLYPVFTAGLGAILPASSNSPCSVTFFVAILFSFNQGKGFRGGFKDEGCADGFEE